MKLIINLTLFYLFLILIVFTNFIISTNTEDMALKMRNKKFKYRHSKKKKFFAPDQESYNLNNINNNLAQKILQKYKDEIDLSDLNLGDGPIFFEGWIKYFKYQSIDLGSKPKSFFKNQAFYDQKRTFPIAEVNTKVNGIYKFIPRETAFYAVLFEDRLNIMNSKINKYQSTYDILLIDFMTPIVENTGFSGGIQDFGSFVEGYCFKIETAPVILREVPKSKENIQSWIFCTDNAGDKSKMMSFILRLKIKRQRMSGLFLQTAIPKPPETVQGLLNTNTNTDKDKDASKTALTPVKNEENTISYSEEHKFVDGYWIVLQDWTQCSLKCGGGTSTLQRMCVPPKNGGKPCDGSAIVNKPCNIQPCPEVKSFKNAFNTTDTLKKPIVKIVAFSNRPQRYTKCIVKESDLLMTKNVIDQSINYGKDQENFQIPVRVVMNNLTISVFTSDDYASNILTFSLEFSNFKLSKLHPNCFIIKELFPGGNNPKKAEFCPFGLDKSSSMNEEWNYDFNLFKYQCRPTKGVLELDNEADILKDSYKKKIVNIIFIKDGIKKEIVDEKRKLIADKVNKQNQDEVAETVMKANQIALQAIQKEIKIEKILEQEELAREKEKESELLQQLEQERIKKENLKKAIKERELEDQYNLKVKAAEGQIEKIKELAQKQVIIRRNQLKSKMLQMRKQAERKQKSIMQQLKEVKLSMAQDMTKVYKEGDSSKCEASTDTGRDDYCTANFMNDYLKYDECKDPENFCYVCCENEFGDLKKEKRTKCFEEKCGKKNKNGENNDQGSWVWVENIIK